METDSERRDLALLRWAITEWPINIERIVNANLMTPDPGSPAAADAAWCVRLPYTGEGDPADEIGNLVWIRLVAMCDYLRAMGGMVGNDDGGLYSPAVLGRSAVEAAGSVAWLTEPGLDPRTRLQRTLAERIHSFQLHNLGWMLRAAKPEEKEGVEPVMRQKLASHVAMAKAAGIRIRWEDGLVTVVGTKKWHPDNGARADALLLPKGAGRRLLAQLGGAVHGAETALLDAFDWRDPSGSPRAALAKGINLTGLVVQCCWAAADRVFAYYQWDTGDWHSAVRQWHQELRALAIRHPIPEPPALNAP